MNEIDHDILAKKIVKSMTEGGYIQDTVNKSLTPLLEKHKKETIKEMQVMALAIGIDCDDQKENQKDFAWTRATRLKHESIENKVIDLGIKAAFIGFLAWIGFKDGL